MIEAFKEIEKEENGVFHLETEKHSFDTGVHAEQDTYYLALKYRRFDILVEYGMGIEAYGRFYLHLPEQSRRSQFTIEAKNTLRNLFGRKEAFPFKLTCSSSNLLDFFEQSSTLKIIAEQYKTFNYDPVIYGKNDDGKFLVQAYFHTAFKERTEVIRPMLAFYKELIDYIQP